MYCVFSKNHPVPGSEMTVSQTLEDMQALIQRRQHTLVSQRRPLLIDCGVRVLQGVQKKLCFFKILCNHSLAFIAVKDLQSSQRNASVQSLLAVQFDQFPYN